MYKVTQGGKLQIVVMYCIKKFQTCTCLTYSLLYQQHLNPYTPRMSPTVGIGIIIGRLLNFKTYSMSKMSILSTCTIQSLLSGLINLDMFLFIFIVTCRIFKLQTNSISSLNYLYDYLTGGGLATYTCGNRHLYRSIKGLETLTVPIIAQTKMIIFLPLPEKTLRSTLILITRNCHNIINA